MTTITRFRLLDVEWERIVQCSNLPAQARQPVEEAIALFRAFEAADRHTASETRAELQKAHDLAVELHSQLATMMANPDAHVALTVGGTPQHDGSSTTDSPATHRSSSPACIITRNTQCACRMAFDRTPSTESYEAWR